MRQAGLKIHIDGIGNIFGRMEGSEPKAPAVLAGSHLDTVIHGGKYDGPVGVIGALEAVRTIAENKIMIRSPLEVVCFIGEESSRFGFSTLGSSLVAGEDHLAEKPRHRVAARSGQFVDDHGLRAIDRARRNGHLLIALAEMNLAELLAAQVLNDVISQRPASVEAF